MAPQSNTSTSRPIVSDGFERCMVEADPAARSTRKTILRRSMAVSILLECLAVAVAILWPLFSTYPLVAKSNVFVPIPPYGPSHQPQAIHTVHLGERSYHGPTSQTTIVFHPPTAVAHPTAPPSDRWPASDLPGGPP